MADRYGPSTGGEMSTFKVGAAMPHRSMSKRSRGMSKQREYKSTSTVDGTTNRSTVENASRINR